MPDDSVEIRLTVLGVAVSANKGAASMAYGLFDGLAAAGVSASIALLTTYPAADQEALDRARLMIPDSVSVSTVNASPIRLLTAFMAALPIRLLDRFRVPLGPLGNVELIREIRGSDLTVDLAGISFADGRGIALLGYNTVMSLFPYLAGGEVVKASQAIGPTNSFLTRTAAKLVLPRMAMICARGSVTRGHLDALNLGNVVDAADIAFLMDSEWRGGNPSTSLSAIGSDQYPVIAFLPSAVVDAYASRSEIDHVGTMAEVIDALTGEGATVIVAPHSYRTSGERGRMNDGPIVADIERRTTGSATFIDRDLDPRELRAIIQRADVVVTGRFHGMVSALEVGTPPVVIGWSHKYGEVLDQFGVHEQGIRVDDLSSANLLELVRKTLDERVKIIAAIHAAQADVHRSARENITVILQAATAGRVT